MRQIPTPETKSFSVASNRILYVYGKLFYFVEEILSNNTKKNDTIIQNCDKNKRDEY